MRKTDVFRQRRLRRAHGAGLRRGGRSASPVFRMFWGLSIGRQGLLPRCLVFAGGIFAESCLLPSDIRSCGVLLFGDICFSRSHTSAVSSVFRSVVCRRAGARLLPCSVFFLCDCRFSRTLFCGVLFLQCLAFAAASFFRSVMCRRQRRGRCSVPYFLYDHWLESCLYGFHFRGVMLSRRPLFFVVSGAGGRNIMRCVRDSISVGGAGAAVPVYPAETEMTSAGTAGPTRITGGVGKVRGVACRVRVHGEGAASGGGNGGKGHPLPVRRGGTTCRNPWKHPWKCPQMGRRKSGMSRGRPADGPERRVCRVYGACKVTRVCGVRVCGCGAEKKLPPIHIGGSPGKVNKC